jgi:hypothetical protein
MNSRVKKAILEIARADFHLAERIIHIEYRDTPNGISFIVYFDNGTTYDGMSKVSDRNLAGTLRFRVPEMTRALHSPQVERRLNEKAHGQVYLEHGRQPRGDRSR